MTPNPVEKQCLVNNQTITTAVLDLGPCTWASALSLATISNMIFSQHNNQVATHTSLAHYCLQPATVTRDCSFPDTDHTRTNKLYIHLQDLIVIKPIQKRLDLARVTKNKGSHLNDLNHWLALAHCSPPRIFESRKPAQPNIHSSQPPLASRNFTFCGQFTFFSVPRPLFGFPATFSRICSAVVQQRPVSPLMLQTINRCTITEKAPTSPG